MTTGTGKLDGDDGRLRGHIRQLRPSDMRLFAEHLQRLDAQSRRDRFNGPARDEFLLAYAERCFSDGTTVIGYVENGHVLGAAELHERPEDHPPTARSRSVSSADVSTGVLGPSCSPFWCATRDGWAMSVCASPPIRRTRP